MRMAKIHCQYLEDVLVLPRKVTKPTIKWVAERMRDNRWVVRPEGQLGTMGWHPEAWTAAFVTARSEGEALRKAGRL